MNSCNLKNNLLFLSNDQQSINTFYTRCLQCVKDGKIVLLLTDGETSNKDLLPILKEAKLNETELKRFVIINVDTLDACVDKLCEQHDWAWIPALIIVDMRLSLINSALQYVSNDVAELDTSEADEDPMHYIQQLALCIANLFEYQLSVLKRIEDRTTITTFETNFSILILNEESTHLTREQIDLLINLYYYKKNAFNIVEEILFEIGI